MAWPAVLAGILGAGGSIAGGVLGSQGGVKPSDMIQPSYNPALDYALQVAQYDALNQLGFGNLSNIPNPMQQLTGQINAANVDNKTKRRALVALQNISQDPTLIEDPYGTNFTRDEVFNANKTQTPFGRVMVRGKEGTWLSKNKRMAAGGAVGGIAGGAAAAGAGAGAGAAGGSYIGPVGAIGGAIIGSLIGLSAKGDTEPTGMPVQNIGRLNQALQAVGLNLDDIKAKLAEKVAFDKRMAALKSAGLDELGTQTIINRAKASANAASLLGDAGRFATGGDPSEFQSGILDRLNRNYNDQETALMLQAQFGGFNPSAGLESLRRMRGDSELTALTQAVQAANAISAGLSGGNQLAQSAAGLGTNAGINSLGIAAQQAAAANRLAQGTSINRADSLANGVAGGLSGLGNTLLASTYLNQRSPGYTNGSSSGGSSGSEWNW